MNNTQFIVFFNCCIGTWRAERTYHYLTHQEIERSRTEFTINPLTVESKSKVLSDNQYPDVANLADIPGFNLRFYTISEKGEEVSQNLNFLFIATQEDSDGLEGDYLRDQAYEEARPILSHFRFNSQTQELLMTTQYSRVISVDSITLVNPNLRIRKILNYQRPAQAGQPLDKLILVGFGVEQKENS